VLLQLPTTEGSHMNEADILEQRRLARSGKQLIDADLVALHRRAVEALLDAARGNEVRRRALSQVEKWDRGHLCNPHYIKAWRDILLMPTSAIGLAILRDDAEGVSLRQNSPFGFLVKEAV
jgi:hypothetical protein